MTFREITPADLPATLHIRMSTIEHPFTLEQLRESGITAESLTQMIATTHKGWLCEIEGEIVGFAIGDRSQSELWVIAVLPSHEGKGIGRRLMTLVQDWLFDEGCERLWLVTGLPMSRAYFLYRNLGWIDCGSNGDGIQRRMELPKPTSV